MRSPIQTRFDDLPETLPVFPLSGALLLPWGRLPLNIFEPRYAQLVQDCMATGDPVFGVVLISQGLEVGGGDARSDVGALARISQCADLGMGQYQVVASVGERIRVLEWLPDKQRLHILLKDEREISMVMPLSRSLSVTQNRRQKDDGPTTTLTTPTPTL